MSTPHRSLSRRHVVAAGVATSAAIALGGSLASTAAQELVPVTLALDWYPNANHAGIFMAEDRGYFTEAGLDVTISVPSDPTTVLQTVGAGRDTFGISYQSEVLFARGQDVPIVSVAALVQHPLNSLMVLADSDIETPADLAGKTIANSGLPADDAFIHTILTDVGLTTDDVTLVNVGYDLMPAVLSGRADAVIGVYWTHETILAEREGSPVRYFRVEEWGVPDYYELVLVSGEGTIADQPEVVTAMLGALQRGYDAAIADPQAAVDLLVAESPDLLPDVELEGLELLIPLWTDDGAIPFGLQTEERWTSYGDWLKAEGLLAEDVDIDSAWTGDLLPMTATATPVS
jgi:putative hydroxymethylpyrimidine transport system substrate-binding protein